MAESDAPLSEAADTEVAKGTPVDGEVCEAESVAPLPEATDSKEDKFKKLLEAVIGLL